MKTLILLFSLVSFCTVLSNAKPVLSGGRVMVENAAVGMSAGFTNTFSFLDEDNASKDDTENNEDVKNGSRDINTHGIKNGGHSDVVKYSPQNGSDINTHGIKNGGHSDVVKYSPQNGSDINTHGIKNGGHSDVVKYSPQNGSDRNTHGIKNGGHSDVVKYPPQNGSDGNTQVNNNRIEAGNPNTIALINEWISLAKPPINATECAQTRYEAWGRMVGRTKGAMVIRAAGKPDNVGGMSSSEYLWSMRDQLDSVDHCTLGEYVTAKLDNQSIAHCKGRYKPKGPKANEVLGEGRQYWNQGKLDQAIGHISEGKEHVCDDQQVNKTLSVMKKQKNDIDKRLKTTSSFIDNKKLDEAESSLSKAAIISDKYVKYIEMKQRLEDARKKLQEEKIADIKKQVQEQAQKNADVREHEREEAQKEAGIKREAEEERQREAENQRHIHEKADEARQRAREQAQKNADARENARIKAAEDKRRAQRKAEERRIARKKAEEARRRAQRKADAQRHAQRKADAQRRARRKAEEARKRAERRAHRNAESRRQAYINAQRNEEARRRAQREAQIRRNAQIKSQRDAATFMNTMIKFQQSINASRHRQPTRTPMHTPTHSHTHQENSNSNNLNFLGVEAHSAPRSQAHTHKIDHNRQEYNRILKQCHNGGGSISMEYNKKRWSKLLTCEEYANYRGYKICPGWAINCRGRHR